VYSTCALSKDDLYDTYKEYIQGHSIPLTDFDADTHQREYGAYMRIRVSDSITIPSLSRELDGSVILSINTELSFEDIEGFIGDQFEPGEREITFLLWADDETKRVFTPISGTTDFYIDLRPED
jgi:hypothetical protein